MFHFWAIWGTVAVTATALVNNLVYIASKLFDWFLRGIQEVPSHWMSVPSTIDGLYLWQHDNLISTTRRLFTLTQISQANLMTGSLQYLGKATNRSHAIRANTSNMTALTCIKSGHSPILGISPNNDQCYILLPTPEKSQ